MCVLRPQLYMVRGGPELNVEGKSGQTGDRAGVYQN